MRFDADRLMELLPAVYRLRDADRGELRTLLAVLAREIGVVEEDLAQLYDDQFIETCAEWVVPYIGDLLGTTPLYQGGRDADARLGILFPDLLGPNFTPRGALRSRADVARTIFYRARTATPAMLEILAADVTGWGARVVEIFERLRWNQWIPDHLRPACHGCPDLRHNESLERLHGPFDSASYTVDVRPIGQNDGWHEVRNVAFFLWRLRSYPLPLVDARAFTNPPDFRYHANRLGAEVPLFTLPQRSEDRGVLEWEVPGPIREALFREDLKAKQANPGPPPATKFYGQLDPAATGLERSLAIFVDKQLVPPENICVADLKSWRRPSGKRVAVDVRTGQISLGKGYPATAYVQVSYHYGFPGDVGGGTYARSSWIIRRDQDKIYTVSNTLAKGNIKKALDDWVNDGRPNAILVLDDNRTYVEDQPLKLDPPAGGRIAIEANDHKQPHVIAQQKIVVACTPDPLHLIEGMVTLSGLLIEGRIAVDTRAGILRLLHSTVAPASMPSIDVTAAKVPSETFRLEMAFSISGPIHLSPACRGITIVDSIVDGGTGDAIAGTMTGETGPALRIERSTVFGATTVRALPLGSETIFTGKLFVERRQEGCVRFSYLAPDSRTPRRYRCQPDLEIAARSDAAIAQRRPLPLSDADRAAIADTVRAFLVPVFTSTHYPDPGYAQLGLSVPRQIFTGAEDFAEIGVYCHLKQPQRETNLRARLVEHLPFGLQPGIIYVT
jgi:hypothetical protein